MANRIVLNETSYHGRGAIENVALEAIARGFKKAFVCSDPDLIKFHVADKVLDVLKKHNAPGNFFVVESYIKNNPEIIKRMEKEGHLVCNHSVSHVSMASIHDEEKFKKEILDVANTYKEVTGHEMPKYFRPPMGKFSEESLKMTNDLGYASIFWSFAYVDWYNNQQPTHEFAKNKIYSRTHPGAIVLLHSNSQTNSEILDEVITHWEDEGYTLKSLDYLNKKK